MAHCHLLHCSSPEQWGCIWGWRESSKRNVVRLPVPPLPSPPPPLPPASLLSWRRTTFTRPPPLRKTLTSKRAWAAKQLDAPSQQAFLPSPKEESTSHSVDGGQEDFLFDGTKDFEFQPGYSTGRVCDRLAEVLLTEKTETRDWKKLLIASQDWTKLRPYFFKRCRYRAEKEVDSKKKATLLNLARKLRKVDSDMQKHSKLLAYVEEHWPELDVVVAGRRKEFNDDYFQHIELLSEMAYDTVDKRDGLARIATKCLAAVEAHDRAAEDDVANAIAQKKFEDILESSSLDEASSKIELLAKKKQLDSPLTLLITKAWAAAKESDKMNPEIRELMHHLYMVARANLHRMIPKEVQIIKHLLSIEDPSRRFAELTDSFCPGDDNDKKNMDNLYTKPEKLHKWVKLVLDAYHFNKQNTLIESARHLTTPMTIRRLQLLKETLEEQFL